jgi:hypothetical protein
MLRWAIRSVAANSYKKKLLVSLGELIVNQGMLSGNLVEQKERKILIKKWITYLMV